MAGSRRYQIEFKPSAAKALRRLPGPDRRRIVRAVEALASNPRPEGCKKLIGADDLWRIRVRDYRVVYMIQDRKLLVLVLRVRHRRDVYR